MIGKVLRIWEHSLKKSPQACIARVRRALEGEKGKAERLKSGKLIAGADSRSGEPTAGSPQGERGKTDIGGVASDHHFVPL